MTLKSIFGAVFLAATVLIGTLGHAQQVFVWDCRMTGKLSGKYGTSGMTFRMQVANGGRVVGSGQMQGGGVPEAFQFEGQAGFGQGQIFQIHGTMLGQVLGQKPFFFQSKIINDYEMYFLNKQPSSTYASECKRIQ